MDNVIKYNSVISVQPLDTNKALDNIFYTKDFLYLQEQIIDDEEVNFENNKEYKILYKNGKNFNKNLYTDISDNSSLIWLGIYDNSILIGLQLISIEDDYIELIIIEKNNNYKSKNSIFKIVIDYCLEKYKMDIKTFPLNDDLTNFYKKFGFVDDKEGYIKLEYNK